MAKVRVHHDGWLALPAAVRKRPGLSTGDQLELELAAGGVLLRRARCAAAANPSPEPITAAVPSASAAPPAAAAKRGPGRPRKTPLPVVPPTLKARGGRRKAAATAEPGQRDRHPGGDARRDAVRRAGHALDARHQVVAARRQPARGHSHPRRRARKPRGSRRPRIMRPFRRRLVASPGPATPPGLTVAGAPSAKAVPRFGCSRRAL